MQKDNRILLKIVLMIIINKFLIAQNFQEIIVTIEKIPSEEKLLHFNNGEKYREQMRFREAISEYKKVIDKGSSCTKESEAHYNIGLCHTWLGNLDSAEAVFNTIISAYQSDGLAIGFTQFGLAWIDVQREEFDRAIQRLQQTLDSKVCPNREHNAMIQFQIGRIYMNYLNDMEKAREVFKLVLEKYPNTEITNHPYLDGLKQ